MLGVEKVEGDDVGAKRGKRVRESDDERALLAGAGAVGENQRAFDGLSLAPGRRAPWWRPSPVESTAYSDFSRAA